MGQSGCYWNQTNSYWHIGSAYGSSRISYCNPNYNCHGFVVAYFENKCRPAYDHYITPPYSCPYDRIAEDPGDDAILTDAWKTTGKYARVCNEADANVVSYDIQNYFGGHSAVKIDIPGGGIKYMSKYGNDGPLVLHNLNGSHYHYLEANVDSTHFWTYIGGINGNEYITGTNPTNYSVINKSGVSYSWSIVSGYTNIYISSGSSQSSVTLTPLHSGTAVLRLTSSSNCGSQSQQITLTIQTNICLEGTYDNAGMYGLNLNTTNSVATGSVSATVTCPDATSYTWQKTSGNLSYYASGANVYFTMTSGSSISFNVTARNSSNTVLGSRSITFYNYGSYMASPNPASTSFKIDVIGGVALTVVLYDLHDNSIVQKTREYKARSSIDVSSIAPGTYILKIYRGDKMVKEQRLKISR